MAEDKTENINTSEVKVAVRVRPMSLREIDIGAESILSISGETVKIDDPNNKGITKEFIYDYTYDKDTSQETIFQELGLIMLNNALSGYHCAVFAYGQTGAGKTFTILGPNECKGIGPRFVEELFKGIENKTQNGIFCQVKLSVLEIYNEDLRDLLNMGSGRLTIREDQTEGVYVQNVTWVTLRTSEEASDNIERAMTNRVIAATKMNSSSSRSHTIIRVALEQTNSTDKTIVRSNIELVDLAGSERSSKTGATGDRLREAVSINKSLSTLGNVISALAQVAEGKKVLVPYRDSKVTRLLKNALGGNCRTFMIANVSPSDYCFEETLSTLRYANRVKRIQNKVKVNSTDVDISIKEIQSKKELLEKKLLQLKSTSGEEDTTEVSDFEKQIQEREADIRRIQENISGLQSGSSIARKIVEQDLKQDTTKESDDVPYLLNLHEDPALSGKIYHYIKQGATIIIGNPRGSASDIADVILLGPRIAVKHAAIENSSEGVIVRPLDGIVYVNGKLVDYSMLPLNHNDRVMFGGNSLGLFVFKDPKEEKILKQQNKPLQVINYDFAQREVARYANVEIYLSSEDIFLKEQIVRLEQSIKEANAMASELKRKIWFDIVLISAFCLGEVKDMCHTFIQGWYEAKGTESDFLWSTDDFYDRFAMMSAVYGKMSEQTYNSALPDEETDDPFVEPVNASTLIGVAFVPLMGLATMKKTEDKFSVSSAKTTGYVNIAILPCDTNGQEINDYIDPSELLGHELNFKIKIMEATDLPDKYTHTWCQYSFYMDAEDVETELKAGRNPNYNFCKQYRQTDVTQNFLDYLETSQLIIQVFGKALETGTNTNDENSVEALREKIKDLRERKKIKHDKMKQKKAEVRQLKEVIKTKDELLDKIKERLKGSNDPAAKDVLEMLKAND